MTEDQAKKVKQEIISGLLSRIIVGMIRPVLIMWALNQYLLHIDYTFWNYLATMLLIAVLYRRN